MYYNHCVNKKVNICILVCVIILANIIASPLFAQTKADMADTPNSNAPTITDIPDEEPIETPTVSITTGQDVLDWALKCLDEAYTIDCYSTGTVVSNVGGVKQNTYSSTQRDPNGNVLNVSASVNCAGIAGKDVYTLDYVTNGTVYERTTSKVSSSFVPTFTSGWQSISVAQYQASNGVLCGDLNYIINDETILNVGQMKRNYLKTSNGITTTFSTKVTLDLEKSVEKYKLLLKNMSESTIMPVFTKVELTFYVDKDGVLQSMQVKECYKIKSYGLSVEMSADMTTVYKSFDNYFIIKDPRV